MRSQSGRGEQTLKEQRLYIVAGMHRSGTSAFARLLQALGISVKGNLREAAEDNLKGFWEDRDVVDLNDRILARLGCEWHSIDGFFFTRKDFASPRFNRLKNEAKLLLREKLGDGPDWGVKDPRFSRLLGFWGSVFAALELNPVYIVPVRNPADVAASLAKRNGFDAVKSQLLWLLYNLDLFASLENETYRIVHYEQLLESPREVLGQLAPLAGLEASDLDEARVAEFCEGFLERDMQHNRDSELDPALESCARLYALLRERVDSRGQPDAGFLEAISLLRQPFERGTDLALTLGSVEAQRAALETACRDREEQIRSLDEAFHREEDRLNAMAAELSGSATFYREREAAVRKDAERLQTRLAEQRQATDDLQAALTKSGEWAEKLEGDLSRQREVISDLEASLEESAQWAQRLDAQLAEVNDFARQETARANEALDELGRLQQQLNVERESLRLTTEQLDTVSTQRDDLNAELGQVYGSLSWRLTRPLRWGNYQLRRLPGAIRRALKQSAKWLISLLPRESWIRQALVQLYLRVRAGLRGELDSRALRDSHRAVIAHRQRVLGGFPRLDAAALPELDISVVTHNSEGWIERFVDSLVSQDYPLDRIALYIVDNASSDTSVALWNRQRERLGALRDFELAQAANRGYGAGHNLGIGMGAAAFVLVSNVDLEFKRDTLTELVSFAAADQQDVASWEPRQQPYEHPKFYDPVTLETGWSSHACILLRRRVFETVGGYEDRIFMYGEDVELSYRFRSVGYRLRYVPRSVVLHYTYDEAGELKPLQFFGSTLSNAFLRLRYGSLIDILAIPALYAGLLAADHGLPNARKQLWNNVVQIVRNAPYFIRQRRKDQHFPFRGWDYELTRDGAFHVLPDSDRQEAPLVSVVTRSFRGRDALLREAMQSVLHQTWPNVELVIVEDGGDALRDTVESVRRQYPESTIRYESLPKLGRCLAGNEGLARARGDFLMFLDDDDLLFSDHIEVCVSELLADDSLGGVYALSWDVQTDFETEDDAVLYEEMSHSTDDILRQPFDRELLQHHNYIAIQAIVFRRELYDRYGGFDPELDNLEDWNLWLRYSSEQDFKLVEKTTSMFRTPWDLADKTLRQQDLDSYYLAAREKNDAFLASLGQGDSA